MVHVELPAERLTATKYIPFLGVRVLGERTGVGWRQKHGNGEATCEGFHFDLAQGRLFRCGQNDKQKQAAAKAKCGGSSLRSE
jgi:hypothetical protein